MQPIHFSGAQNPPSYGNPIVDHDEGKHPASNTTSGEASSPLTCSPRCGSVEQEDAQQELPDVLTGEHLVEKLMHSDNVVWAADVSPEQGIGNTPVGSPVTARPPELPELPSAKTPDKNQEKETTSEQASREKWGRVVQDLQAAFGTITFWNFVLLICVNYSVLNYSTSDFKQQLLAKDPVRSIHGMLPNYSNVSVTFSNYDARGYMSSPVEESTS